MCTTWVGFPKTLPTVTGTGTGPRQPGSPLLRHDRADTDTNSSARPLQHVYTTVPRVGQVSIATRLACAQHSDGQVLSDPAAPAFLCSSDLTVETPQPPRGVDEVMPPPVVSSTPARLLSACLAHVGS